MRSPASTMPAARARCPSSPSTRSTSPDSLDRARRAASPGPYSAPPHGMADRPGGLASLSPQLDLAFDLVRQADAADRDRTRGRESFVALELALRQGLADGLLDLALCAHPQRFEKFANAAVEDVLVHNRLLCGV